MIVQVQSGFRLHNLRDLYIPVAILGVKIDSRCVCFRLSLREAATKKSYFFSPPRNIKYLNTTSSEGNSPLFYSSPDLIFIIQRSLNWVNVLRVKDRKPYSAYLVTIETATSILSYFICSCQYTLKTT